MPVDLSQLACDEDVETLRLVLPVTHHPTTALTNALMKAVWRENLEIVTLLLEAGADPNIGEDGVSPPPVCFAAEYGWLEGLHLLLKHGGDVNSHVQDGWTPLLFAVDGEADAAIQLGRPPSLVVLQFLLTHGADPVKADHHGLTPAKLAWEYGWKEAAFLLGYLDADGDEPRQIGNFSP